jgi:Phosphotransferase enzyme family
MKPLRHGYTNKTSRSGHRVRKQYLGKGAEARLEIEWECLRSIHGVIPAPRALQRSRLQLEMSFVEGSHGQDLIDAGSADMVLRLTGELLKEVQQIPANSSQIPGSGEVLVHGDFGPQNILIDAEAETVTALLDWEFAHRGLRIEDVAWAEWIVRMHHPTQIDHLGSLFDGYGSQPSWSKRRSQMIARCEELVLFAGGQDWPTPRTNGGGERSRQRVGSNSLGAPHGPW